MTTIQLTDNQLRTIQSALETYYRLRSGQIGMALEEVYPDKMLSWDEKDTMERLVKQMVFPLPTNVPDDIIKHRPGLHANEAFGIGQKALGDANLAYELYGTIRQYLAVKRNDGWFGCNTSFDDPVKVTEEPLPVIEGFTKTKLFPVPKKLQKKVWTYMDKCEQKTCTTEEAQDIWNALDKEMELPQSNFHKIVEQDGKLFVQATRPRKDNIL